MLRREETQRSFGCRDVTDPGHFIMDPDQHFTWAYLPYLQTTVFKNLEGYLGTDTDTYGTPAFYIKIKPLA